MGINVDDRGEPDDEDNGDDADSDDNDTAGDKGDDGDEVVDCNSRVKVSLPNKPPVGSPTNTTSNRSMILVSLAVVTLHLNLSRWEGERDGKELRQGKGRRGRGGGWTGKVERLITIG